MTRRKLDELDDAGPRVFTPDGRRIRGRTLWERHVLATARRMRKAGEKVGQVEPLPTLLSGTRSRARARSSLSLSARRPTSPSSHRSPSRARPMVSKGAGRLVRRSSLWAERGGR